MIRTSFFMTFLILFGSSFITILEALTTSQDYIRHILNVETAVGFIAGYVYSIILSKLKDKDDFPDADTERDIMKLRYLDWMVTTPLLIISLLLFIQSQSSTKIRWYQFMIPILLNYMMLFNGYVGEFMTPSKKIEGGILGFSFFALLILSLYHALGSTSFFMKWIFACFVFIWSLYGVVYFIKDTKWKHISYNMLDLISKCFFGLFCWFYFIQIIDSKKTSL